MNEISLNFQVQALGEMAVLKFVCFCFRENCLAVKTLFCHQEWLMIEENKGQGIYFKSRKHFRLPNCLRLPSLHNGTRGCSKANLFDLDPDRFTCKKTT